MSATGGCLEIHGGEIGRDGARVQLWPCHGGPNQQWEFQGGSLKNAAGGCLDLQGWRTTDGSRFVGWTCNGKDNQRFAARRRHVWSGRPLDDQGFGALLDRVNRASFSSDKVAQIELGARASGFRAAQVKRLLDAIAFSEDKLRALDLLAPRLVDPQNGGLIVEGFAFSGDRERAAQLLAGR